MDRFANILSFNYVSLIAYTNIFSLFLIKKTIFQTDFILSEQKDIMIRIKQQSYTWFIHVKYVSARYIDNYLLMSVTFHGRSSSHGRKTIPAVSSGYGADTLLDWYRSAYRFWLVHAQCTALAAVIAAEEHGYQINMDYFNAQNNEFYVCPHYCERQRDYWVILFHRKILMRPVAYAWCKVERM